mmetsp:Transcript_18386/g.38279  ORF Transcript_18386/g.38279 Transcript_18386/m.38279 type:complete len:907 (+) Transcript_18386:176-2896(+)
MEHSISSSYSTDGRKRNGVGPSICKKDDAPANASHASSLPPVQFNVSPEEKVTVEEVTESRLSIKAEFPKPERPKGRPRLTSAAPYLSPGPVRRRKKTAEGKVVFVNNDDHANVNSSHGMEVCRLPRGGIYVVTTAGPVLIGSPSGTLKDLLSLELAIPKFCIVPLGTFSRHLGNHLGLNLAEYETIALYRRYMGETTPLELLCDSASRAADIRAGFNESFMQTTSDKQLKANDYPVKILEDEPLALSSEIDYLLPCLCTGNHFQRKTDSCDYAIENIINLKTFSDDGIDGVFTYVDSGVLEVSREEGHGGAFRLRERSIGSNEDKKGGKISVSSIIKLPESLPVHVKPFLITPPLFGVTILGNSNGFDPHGLLTGYIIWVNRRGILVNPPAYCAARLESEMGIHPSMIHCIILTTTHGDFDQGCFQKILQEERVTVHSTKSVYDKFIRKYAGLSRLRPKLLRSASRFRKVVVGLPLKIRGANFEFFYNVDSVLSLGFTVAVEGRSLLFCGGYTLCGDTTEAMLKEGAMTGARKNFIDALRTKIFDRVFYDIPMGNNNQTRKLLDSLASSDQTFRERILVNHCAVADFPDGISRGPDGKCIKSTLSFEVTAPLYASASNLIETVEDTIFFKGLGVELAGSLVQVAEAKKVKAGQVLVEVGEAIDSLSMIVSGSVNVHYTVGNSKESISTNKDHWVTGDCFGEEALIGGVSSVKAVAASAVELIQINKLDLEWILSGTPVIQRVQKCHDMRLATQPLERILSLNSVLKFMTRSQKLALESDADVGKAKAGDVIWSKGDKADFALILIEGRTMFPDAIAKLLSGLVKKSGTMMVKQEDARHNYCPDTFTSGAWIGNVIKLIDHSGTHKNTLKAFSDCIYFKFSASSVTRLFEANPGLFVSLGSSEFVI